MEVKIQTHDVHLGPEREEIIRAKFEKLSHLAQRVGDESSHIRVDLYHESAKKNDEAYLCTLTLFIPQDTIRAESRNASLETAVDEVLEKVKKPLDRYKDKTQHISDKK